MTPLQELVKENLENAKDNGYPMDNYTPRQIAIDMMDCTDIGNDYNLFQIIKAIKYVQTQSNN